jgi:SAM-dependent methyltransferase
MIKEPTGLRIDIGCGAVKKEGTIGVDIQQHPGVDHVIDIENQPLPFADCSVTYVHSSHFLEHTSNPGAIFAEISRVCADNAQLELWTPYAWSNPAFILDHKTFFTEEIYLHMCVFFVDFWREILKARWILNEFHYVVDPGVLCYLKEKQITLDFALRHLHNVAWEFCAHITVFRSDRTVGIPSIKRTFSIGRNSPRYEVRADRMAPPFGVKNGSLDKTTSDMFENIIRAFAAADSLPPLHNASRRYHLSELKNIFVRSITDLFAKQANIKKRL